MRKYQWYQLVYAHANVQIRASLRRKPARLCLHDPATELRVVGTQTATIHFKAELSNEDAQVFMWSLIFCRESVCREKGFDDVWCWLFVPIHVHSKCTFVNICVCTCLCIYLNIHIHRYIHTYIHTDRQTDRQTYIHTCCTHRPGVPPRGLSWDQLFMVCFGVCLGVSLGVFTLSTKVVNGFYFQNFLRVSCQI